MNSCKIAIKIRLLSILHSTSDLFKALIRGAGINEYARAAYDSKEASHANNASCTALFTTSWLTSFHGLQCLQFPIELLYLLVEVWLFVNVDLVTYLDALFYCRFGKSRIGIPVVVVDDLQTYFGRVVVGHFINFLSGK